MHCPLPPDSTRQYLSRLSPQHLPPPPPPPPWQTQRLSSSSSVRAESSTNINCQKPEGTTNYVKYKIWKADVIGWFLIALRLRLPFSSHSSQLGRVPNTPAMKQSRTPTAIYKLHYQQSFCARDNWVLQGMEANISCWLFTTCRLRPSKLH